MREMNRVLAATWLLIGLAGTARGQVIAGAEPSPGLALTIHGAGQGGSDAADVHSSRLAALYVPQGAPPSDYTPPGPFKATFEGNLTLRLRSYVSFSAEGRGRLTLSVNEKVVLQAAGEDLSKSPGQQVRLNKGANHLVAVYESPVAGDASFRLFWSSKSFRPEPVPPMLLTHAVSQAEVKSLQLREGRFLFAQYRCIKCHTASDLIAAPNGVAMPELAMDAPSLADAGTRFNQSWLAAWISNPRALRPDAHMPRLFRGAGFDPKAQDIAAYLATLGKPPASSAHGNAKEGRRLFANLDCIGCHTLGPTTDLARVSLGSALGKYSSEALRQYLLQPDAHYVWNPMPNFHPSEVEAGDLTAFMGTLAPPAMGPSHGDAARGEQSIGMAGCLNCHQLDDRKSRAIFPGLNDLRADSLARGCLAPDDAAQGNAPNFALSAEQRSALVAFLQTDRKSLGRHCAPEFAERQIAAMRCTACHARDGNESLIGQALDAESQALHQKYPNPPPAPGELWATDQRPPMLTWAGEKLRPQWMAQFITGQVAYKPRYYLRARMPSFGPRAQLIAAGLAEEHGCPPALAPNPKADPDQAEIGRKLVSKVPNVGFSCVQCHSVQDVPPFSPFEAPSINLKYVAERLRHDYYSRWMHDPLRIDPNSKMPRFDDAEGKTSLPAFDGDSSKQFEAIWQYLLQGDQMKPPPQ